MAKKKEKDVLTVSIPRSSMTDEQLGNLKGMVKAKRSLIGKALGADSLEIVVDDERISFPWFEADTENGVNVYSTFITALCETARKLHRVNSKEERKVENEKYTFRCFLLRIGLIGEQYREARKVLLKNLSGSSALGLPRQRRQQHDRISVQGHGRAPPFRLQERHSGPAGLHERPPGPAGGDRRHGHLR